MSSLCNGDPKDLVSIARELTLCSVKARDGTTGVLYADRAMVFLRRAIESGYRDLETLRTDAIFNPLRSRADFGDLLADTKFPTDPFKR